MCHHNTRPPPHVCVWGQLFGFVGMPDALPPDLNQHVIPACLLYMWRTLTTPSPQPVQLSAVRTPSVEVVEGQGRLQFDAL